MLQIHPVPAFSDNYIWLLHAGDRRAFVVDPGDASPVVDALAERSRCAAAEVRAAAVAHCASELDCDDQVFALVRTWKDGFRR